MMLEESHLSDIVCRELSIGAGKGDMTEWQEMLGAHCRPQEPR